jgi:arsenate reductase/ArsR family transcriptional regulator
MTKREERPGAHLEELAETAKGLAHPARLRILAMLADGEMCVCQLTAVLGLAPSTVSQHLSVLSRGSLLADRKEGKLVFYRLRTDEVAAALLPPLLALLADGPAVQADRGVVARLRRIPIAVLCAAELDLHAIGVHPPGTRLGAAPSPPAAGSPGAAGGRP